MKAVVLFSRPFVNFHFGDWRKIPALVVVGNVVLEDG